MLKKITAILALATLFAYSAVNYPYPQNKSYGNSTINTTASNASTTLKSKFDDFYSRFYVEGNCSGTNDCARIRFDDANMTVSEGIAYGMLMMVYFSDASKSYQTQFDKLWKYYNKWKNKSGLMSWKINGFSSVSTEENASNSASDAEFDTGVALVMAYYQFGDKKYLDDAQALIATIRQQEISANNLHKPGAEWDEERNPSYISPAAFEIFKQIETLSTAKSKWESVITANYTLLTQNNNKASSSLFSDWCKDDGTPSSKGTSYSYDAARVPWRLAWANAWFGHATAKTLLGKVVSANKSGYPDNATFIGPFMNAYSASTNQTEMNSRWNTLMGLSGASYYNTALQVLTGLLASGNMPNLKALKGDNCCTGGTVDGLQIDKLDKAANESVADRNFARTWEPWYVFTDKGDKGASTIKNTTFKNITYNKQTKQCEEITDYNVVMQDGSDWVVKIDQYTLDKGQFEYEPYVTIGLDAVNNGSGYKLSNCTGGFKYKYKGAAHNFKTISTKVTDYNYHQMQVSTATTAWTDVLVPTSELAQEAWGISVPFKLDEIEAFSWEVKGGLSTKSGSLSIKDFYCIGSNLTFPAEKPASQCSGGGTSSSSSAKSSSSNVAGSTSSSSSNVVVSSSSAKSSSSSSNSTTTSSSSNSEISIVLPQLVHSNALNPMLGSVNLQALNSTGIQIFDLKGNTIRKLKFESGNYIVQLADLPQGLYVVKATSRSWKQTVKVMVK
ncbi:MAG: T9SS type A sorting domain-containing protein [Fibromonadaceae bacterium]|nr:T9SS type A sorting domain-containing protein [Fibromonadaceae bacterium]